VRKGHLMLRRTQLWRWIPPFPLPFKQRLAAESGD
jgi:hypothetical protein